jgi:hypothetical protein
MNERKRKIATEVARLAICWAFASEQALRMVYLDRMRWKLAPTTTSKRDESNETLGFLNQRFPIH